MYTIDESVCLWVLFSPLYKCIILGFTKNSVATIVVIHELSIKNKCNNKVWLVIPTYGTFIAYQPWK